MRPDAEMVYMNCVVDRSGVKRKENIYNLMSFLSLFSFFYVTQYLHDTRLWANAAVVYKGKGFSYKESVNWTK